MASYHCSIKDPLSRAEGKSLAGKAAYNGRTEYRDARTGEKTKDWAYKGGHVESFVAVEPKANAPEWVKTDRQRLIDAAVLAEKRKDSREGQEIVFAFLSELTPQQNRWMLNDFLREQFTRRDIGRVVIVDIHEPSEQGDQRNDHAHAIVLPRAIGPDGTFSAKRLPELDPQDYQRIREKWAEKGAKELQKEADRARKAGDEGRAAHLEQEAARYRHGHLDLEQQRQAALERGDLAHAETLNRPATKHIGPTAVAMELKGQETERGNAYRDTVQEITAAADLKIELLEVQKAIAQYERQWIAEQPFADLATPINEQERREATGQQEKEIKTNPLPQLTGTRAEMWRAVHASDNAKALAAALADKEIVLAITTKPEAERSSADAKAASEQGLYAPVYREGEIVAVDRHAFVYRFSKDATGSNFNDMQRYLRTLNTSQMKGIDDTRQMMKDRAAAKHREALSQGLHGNGKENRTVARVADRALSKSLSIGASVLGKVADIAGDLLAGPPVPKTRQQIEIQIEENQRNTNAAEKREAVIHRWQDYTDEYEQHTAKLNVQAQEAQQRDEQHKRLQHDRGEGRERER